MSVVYNRKQFGLFDNGGFESGTNTGFEEMSVAEGDVYSGRYCGQVNHTNHWEGSQYVPVNTQKYYTFSVTAKTVTKSLPNNYQGQFYCGFACYDQFQNFIDLRQMGGIGNTTLSRALQPGDQYAYITSNAGWYTGQEYYFRNLMINPASHPYYNEPYIYSRLGFGEVDIYYDPVIVWTGTDYRLTLEDASGNPITMPTTGYQMPAGTPVFNGQAGGSYNYVFVTNIPDTWTNYNSGVFTGESRNSSLPFRYRTKYIKYMELQNYQYSSETTKAVYRVDNITLIEQPDNRTFTLP